MNFRLMVVALLAGATLLFILQNVAAVEIQFLFWSLHISRSLLMFLMISVGMAMGWFMHGYWSHHKKPDNASRHQ